MKPAPLTYILTVPSAALIAVIIVMRGLDVPILWSMVIGVAFWSWLVLMLFALRFPRPAKAPPTPRRRAT